MIYVTACTCTSSAFAVHVSATCKVSSVSNFFCTVQQSYVCVFTLHACRPNKSNFSMMNESGDQSSGPRWFTAFGIHVLASLHLLLCIMIIAHYILVQWPHFVTRVYPKLIFKWLLRCDATYSLRYKLSLDQNQNFKVSKKC